MWTVAADFSADSQLKPIGLVWGWRPPGVQSTFIITSLYKNYYKLVHSSNEPSELSQ